MPLWNPWTKAGKTSAENLPVRKNRQGGYKLPSCSTPVLTCTEADFLSPKSDPFRGPALLMMAERKDLTFVFFTEYWQVLKDTEQKLPSNVRYYAVLQTEDDAKRLGAQLQELEKKDAAPYGYLIRQKEEKITPPLTGIRQELDLWTGVIDSRFLADEVPCTVRTCVDADRDRVAFAIRIAPEAAKRFSVQIAFPLGAPDITGADFTDTAHHTTTWTELSPGRTVFHLRGAFEGYDCLVQTDESVRILPTESPHRYLLCPGEGGVLEFSAWFQKSGDFDGEGPAADVFARSAQWWEHFWKETGVLDFSGSTDPRAQELERRIVLSQYTLAAQDTGSVPPAETGLSCNSWSGKFHLEMTFWHEGWLPLYGRTDLLLRTLPWYREHLPQARALAAANGYRGARWPKQCGPEADNSPSPISPLLIWQQPHILTLLYWSWKATGNNDLVREYADVIRETADFCADFAVKNAEGRMELPAPLIPVQECWPPRRTKNPVFELEYWIFGLRAATAMLEAIGAPVPDCWMQTADRMILPEIDRVGRICAVSGTEETYGRFAVDHPSFLMGYGLLDNGRLDPAVMERSLQAVCSGWDEKSLWGWDFAVMAMTAVRLHRPDLAVDLLLKDTVKNVYTVSGCNRQATRDDLPLYLPGNGSLLIATAMMAEGSESHPVVNPGFPKEGWQVESEGVMPLPV